MAQPYFLSIPILILLGLASGTLNILDASKFVIAAILGLIVYWSRSFQGERVWNNFIGQKLAELGLFSYSLYAVHRPCLLFLKCNVDPMNRKFPSLIWALLATLLSIVFAYMFFLLIEKITLNPLQNLRILHKK